MTKQTVLLTLMMRGFVLERMRPMFCIKIKRICIGSCIFMSGRSKG